MHNGDLAEDYVRRAGVRLTAINVLHQAKSWADVVRECQEAVEPSRSRGCFGPATSPRLACTTSPTCCGGSVTDSLPSARRHVDRLARISRELRRDRELAFYGAEDLVPSSFYKEEDARRALDGAEFVVATASAALAERGGRPGGEPARDR